MKAAELGQNDRVRLHPYRAAIRKNSCYQNFNNYHYN